MKELSNQIKKIIYESWVYVKLRKQLRMSQNENTKIKLLK